METKKNKPAAQIVSGVLKKPPAQEKLTEMFEKIRKGATASLSLPQILASLVALGWEIEPIKTWVPLHYPYRGKWHLNSAWSHKPAEEPDLVELHAKMKKSQSLGLPDEVTIGEHIIMEVDPLMDGSHGIKYFNWKEWVGSDAIRVTSPRGKSFDLGRDHHSIDRPLEYCLYQFNRFFSEGGWKEDASAALGKEIHVPAAQRSRENTGTCPACWGNYKLNEGRLVLHGYQRPGWGHVVGSCDAEKYPPAETSDSGFKMWLEKLESFLKRERGTMRNIKEGLVTQLKSRSGNWIKKGEPTFAAHHDNLTRMTEDNIKMYTREIELYRQLISAWKTRPLPAEGERERGPKFFLKP